MACFIGLLFFASCKKDESTNNDPETPLTITPITEEGFVTDGEEVFVLNSFKYGFVAQGTDLTLFTCTIESGGETTTDETELDNATYNSYECTSTPIISGEIKITGTIKNAKGETASATINVIAKETENYKFIGNYDGSLTGSGSIEVMGQSSDIPGFEYETQLELLAGENDNEVKASYVLEGNTYEVKGTCNGNSVDFEPFTINHEESGITMALNIHLAGVIENNNLHVTGTASGEGNIEMPGYPTSIPYVVNINFDGVLAKQ